MKWYRVIILLTAGFLLASCAFFKPSKELEITPAAKAPEIRNLLATLQTKNDTLKSFKGIGKIKLWKNGRRCAIHREWNNGFGQFVFKEE